MKKILYLFLIILFFNNGKTVAQTNMVSIFDEVWHAYDTLYSGFAVKDIDWDKLGVIYRNKVNKDLSEDELFNIIADMLRHLNDNHVQIAKENPEQHFSAGLFGYLFDDIGFDSTLNIFNSLPISMKYFQNGINSLDGFTYGWIHDSIGYFHFKEFKNLKETQDNMDSIIQYFSMSKALIIDVRRNTGGEDAVGNAIANYFADKKRHYMISAYKNGSGHNDFSASKKWYIEPNVLVNYSKPVFLLIDNTSFSEAEIFALAMREIPNVKLVGDNTSGAYADSEWKVLPCGWNVCIPYSLHTDKNGFCWEGMGIPPNYYIKTDPKESITEKDILIEFSINMINN